MDRRTSAAQLQLGVVAGDAPAADGAGPLERAGAAGHQVHHVVEQWRHLFGTLGGVAGVDVTAP